MSDFKQSDIWRFGAEGEAYVRAWLKAQGFWVVPTSLIERGGAPMLESWVRGQSAVLPDNLAGRLGKTCWIEVKTKTRSTFSQTRQRPESGLPLRHWEAYQRVETATGIEGWLCFLHVTERIYLGTLRDVELGAFVYRGPKHYPEPEIFFDLRRFDWYEPDPDGRLPPLPKPLPPTSVRPWEEDHKPMTRQLPLKEWKLP